LHHNKTIGDKDMVEAKLRVEMTEARNGSKNPFYGNTMVKKVVEDILYHDTDKRKDVAPCGVYATIGIKNKVTLGEGDTPLETLRVFDIKINSRYFDREGDGGYVAYFTIEEKTYEVWVRFENKHLIGITLSEWLQSSYFEDGDNADNIYYMRDFTTISELIC
jgi:hypothetical protein